MEKQQRLLILTSSVLAGMMANSKYDSLTVEQVNRLAIEQAEDAEEQLEVLATEEGEWAPSRAV